MPGDDESDGRVNPASHRAPSTQPPATTTGVAPWGGGGGRVNPASHRPPSMQPPATTTGVAPWGRPVAGAAAGTRDPRGVPNPRLKSGRPPRPPARLSAVGEAELAIPEPLPAFDATTAANNPTDWEDDDTVAPWAEFTAEAQAAKLAELEAFNADLGRAGDDDDADGS